MWSKSKTSKIWFYSFLQVALPTTSFYIFSRKKWAETSCWDNLEPNVLCASNRSVACLWYWWLLVSETFTLDILTIIKGVQTKPAQCYFCIKIQMGVVLSFDDSSALAGANKDIEHQMIHYLSACDTCDPLYQCVLWFLFLETKEEKLLSH